MIAKNDFVECYWCFNRRATVLVIEEFLFGKKISMCNECLAMRKSVFPFEKLTIEVIKYKDAN